MTTQNACQTSGDESSFNYIFRQRLRHRFFSSFRGSLNIDMYNLSTVAKDIVIKYTILMLRHKLHRCLDIGFIISPFAISIHGLILLDRPVHPGVSLSSRKRPLHFHFSISYYQERPPFAVYWSKGSKIGKKMWSCLFQFSKKLFHHLLFLFSKKPILLDRHNSICQT